MFENKLYEGIPEMLGKLRSAGKKLAVATSKPWVFAEPILAHFRLDGYFDEVIGSELDGTRVKKGEVIEEAVRRFGAEASPEKAVMVGDRKHDIIGAKENGILSVGVTYGYGGYEELSQAGADWIVNTVEELGELLAAL